MYGKFNKHFDMIDDIDNFILMYVQVAIAIATQNYFNCICIS